MKRASQLAISRKVRTEQAKRFHTQNQSKMMDSQEKERSPLEQLPVELIQQIFFYSFEINMPRASPHLSQVLSKSTIYTSLILFAYFDDDGESAVEDKYFRPAEYRRVSVYDKVRLQSGILDCKWCTLERIKRCMSILSRLQIVQAWHRESKAESDLHFRDIDVPPHVPNELVRDVAGLPRLDQTEALERHFLTKMEPPFYGNLDGDAHAIGPVGYGNYLPRVITWKSSTDEEGSLHKTTHHAVSTLAARVIPASLLTKAPWTEEQLELLQLLRQGMRFLDRERVLVISAAALFEGMANAIRERKAKVLLVLLELHFATMRHSLGLRLPEGNRGLRMDQRQFGPQSPHPLPLDLFHLACKQGPASSALLSLLIREGIDSIPPDDEVLTTWALRARADGDELAKWLLRHMEGTNDYGLPRWSLLFRNGRLTWPRSEGEYPFPEQSFTDKIGYVYQYGGYAVMESLDEGPCG